MVVSDVTELYYREGKAYLCVHLDFFGKMVYGWHLMKSPNSEIVVCSFRKAVKTIRSLLGLSSSGMIVHQDRGSIYTGTEYTSTVLSAKWRLSYSRKGEPGDNAVNESFFSRLKEEWRDVFIEAKSFEELTVMVRKAIDYYNRKRYHSSIGLETPLKFTKEQVKHLTKNKLKAVS